MPSHVRSNERRLRMCLEEAIALRHELLERRILAGRVAPIPEQRELQPAFVVRVVRLEESQGSAVWMNTGILSRAHASQNGSTSGSSSWRRDPSALRVRRPNPLPISPRPTAPALRSASSHAIAFSSPARSNARETHPGQHANAVAMRAVANHFQHSRQTVARRIVGADHHAQVQAIHRGDEGIQPFGRRGQVPRMAVEIDCRELRFRHQVPSRHQGRTRSVVDDRRRRHLGRLAAIRPDLGRARRALLAGLDGRAEAATPRPAEAAPFRWRCGRRLLCGRLPGPAASVMTATRGSGSNDTRRMGIEVPGPIVAFSRDNRTSVRHVLSDY